MKAGLRILLVLTFFLSLPGCMAPEEPPDFRENIQNVIVIVVDTLAAHNVGYMGYDRDTTPYIDQLASRSVVFDHAYTVKALTLPSFVSFFSGLHLVNHGVTRNGLVIPEDVHLLTEDFRQAGYVTYGLPAAQVIGSAYGVNRGFNYFYAPRLHHIPASTVIEEVRTFIEGPAPEGAPYYADRTQPLFMFIHFFDTHTDYTPDAGYLETWADRGYRGPVDGTIGIFEQYNDFQIELDEDDLQHTRDLYDAEIRTFDDAIVSLFEIFIRNGLLDNSVIMVTADHGENLGEHHYVTHGHPYEPGLAIPLFIHFPGDLGAGTSIDALVENTDFMPTVMDLVGVNIPADIDGQSMLPLIENQSGEDYEFREFLLAGGGNDSTGMRMTFSVFDGEYRLIKDIKWSEESLLYNILNDPKETTDIAADNPDLVEFYETLIDVMAEGITFIEDQDMDPQTEEMLRSLGYI